MSSTQKKVVIAVIIGVVVYLIGAHFLGHKEPAVPSNTPVVHMELHPCTSGKCA